MNRLTPFLTLPLLLLLLSCGGGGGSSETIDSAAEIPAISANDQQLFGYWTTAQTSSPAFEFLGSPTEAPFNIDLQTGRMFEAGKLTNLFYWKMQTNGTVNLSMVSPSCMQRPLNQCPVLQTASIEAKGSSIYNATWSIRIDQNMDGISDRQVSGQYSLRELDTSLFTSGESFFTHANNKIFDNPLVVNIADGSMVLRLDEYQDPIRVTANSYAANNRRIEFQANAQMSVETTAEFSTSTGFKTFPVKRWYENVSIAATANNEYILSYEMHRKVNIPANEDATSVQLNDYENVERKTTVVALINTFRRDFLLPTNARIFSRVEIKFANADAGNELELTSNTNGTLGYTLPFATTQTETKPFTWFRAEDGTYTLNVDSIGEVNLRAIQPINGGYQILYTLPHKRYGKVYRIRDLIYDNPSVVDESTLPGRYKFTSISPLPNGSHEYDLTFHKDKRVTGVVGGYWFQDVNGDIVSYECVNLLGQIMVHYDECVKAFDDLSSVKSAHIRRVRFVYKKGNEYQAKYSGSQFTGGNYDVDYYFTNFLLTYRWTRIGDEPVDND